MPLGLFLAFARVLVAPAFRGRNPDVDDRVAGIHPADFRVRAQITHQNDLVNTTSHETAPRLSETKVEILPRTLSDRRRRCAGPSRKPHSVHILFVLYLF